MAKEKNPYSEMDKELLELSLIDLFVLQRLDILKAPMVRYQLMQDIHTTFPFVSTAKFYRILDKFEKLGLVNVIDKQYILSEDGANYLNQSKTLLDHQGFGLFQYLSTEFESMFELMDVTGEKLLVYDFEEIYEPAFMGLLIKQVQSIHVIYREEVYNYFNKIYPELKLAEVEEKVIMTPDEYFDSVSVTFHADIMGDIDEITRVLRKRGKLFITEVEVEKSKFFIHNVLFDLYAPKHLKRTKTFLDLDYILKTGSFELDQKYEFEGLRIFKLIKS